MSGPQWEHASAVTGAGAAAGFGVVTLSQVPIGQARYYDRVLVWTQATGTQGLGTWAYGLAEVGSASDVDAPAVFGALVPVSIPAVVPPIMGPPGLGQRASIVLEPPLVVRDADSLRVLVTNLAPAVTGTPIRVDARYEQVAG